ncbi:MAG: Nif3-like dinuclear metal center hexameric protein [Desulfobacterota bacterium]|nr:Nif3-like dinuclear metal center hexameric protein [Thermodesulfobacteriota bacterium]
MMELKQLVGYLDSYLQISSFQDDAANGLQVENSELVEKIGVAVDACHEAILKAAEERCSMLIVHHGLFWGRQELIVDHIFQRVRSLIMADIALYAAHLPLDAHPVVGHNVIIANRIGIIDRQSCANYHGTMIGVMGRLPQAMNLKDAAEVVTNAIGACRDLIAFGSEMIRTVAIVAGSATDAGLFKELKKLGIDLLITGEARHGAYHLAQEFGLNIFYGGHYRTEAIGMQALAQHLQDTFSLPAVFIDAPSIF